MKVKWPWRENKKKIAYLQAELSDIKRKLMEARVAHFILVHDYVPGMKLVYDTPKPISLVELQERIEALEENG